MVLTLTAVLVWDETRSQGAIRRLEVLMGRLEKYFHRRRCILRWPALRTYGPCALCRFSNSDLPSPNSQGSFCWLARHDMLVTELRWVEGPLRMSVPDPGRKSNDNTMEVW